MIRLLLNLVGGHKLRLLAGAGGVILMLATLAGGYVKGSSSASTACAVQQTEGIIEGNKRYEEIRHTVMQMSPAELDDALAKWMRD